MSSALSSQCLLGMQCDDFTIITADQTNTQSMVVMKNELNATIQVLGKKPHSLLLCALGVELFDKVRIFRIDEDKIYEIGNNVMMGVIGNTEGDTAQFVNFVSKNIKLYRIQHGYDLSTASIVHFARNTLVETLKDDTPTSFNILIGGHDTDRGAELYTMDSMASSVKVPFSAFGEGGDFCLSILHEYHRKTLTVQEAYEVMELCVKQIHRRVFVNLPRFKVKVVSKQGIQILPIITPAPPT